MATPHEPPRFVEPAWRSSAVAGARPKPVILAVDPDRSALARIRGELDRRYGRDYQIACERSPTDALARLQALQGDSREPAIVLAYQWMTGLSGTELLARVKDLFPCAKRALLIDWGGWGDRATAAAILEAMALGTIDYYVLRPWQSPDELFHRTITEFLHEWTRTESPGPREIAVVADQWSPRAHELRSLLVRNGVPHVFYASESPTGRRLLRDAGEEGAGVPIVILVDGRVLVDPTNPELAAAYGVDTDLEEREFDLIVVGAGPAGLAAAVYGSSEGLRTLTIEREAIGGQAGSSSLIRNYLGFSRGVSGADLAQRAYQQAWVFGARFLLMREVVALRARGGRQVLTLSDGSEASAGAVVLSTGVSYRRLDIPTLEELNGAGVFYGASVSEAQALAGREVYVLGGGNSAGQAAVHLCRYASAVHVLVRGPSLADSMSSYLRELIAATPNIEVHLNTEVVGGAGAGMLEQLTLRDTLSGESRTVPAAALFVHIGAHPRTDWLPPEIQRDEWGYVLTGQDVRRLGGPPQEQPRMLETSVPRVFAAGDLRHGAIKRVAAAVGEGSVVIRHVLESLAREEPVGGRLGSRAADSSPTRSHAA